MITIRRQVLRPAVFLSFPLLAPLALAGCSSRGRLGAGAGLVALDPRNFESEVLRSPIPVCVDFWADWCAPCRRFSPVVEEVAREFDGRLKVGKYDVDSDESVPVKYGIEAIPTVLCFREGKVVETQIGPSSRDELRERFQKVLGAPAR